jgi:hypothetical protein
MVTVTGGAPTIFASKRYGLTRSLVARQLIFVTKHQFKRSASRKKLKA